MRVNVIENQLDYQVSAIGSPKHQTPETRLSNNTSQNSRSSNRNNRNIFINEKHLISVN